MLIFGNHWTEINFSASLTPLHLVQVQTKFESMHIWVQVTWLKGASSPVAQPGQVT